MHVALPFADAANRPLPRSDMLSFRRPWLLLALFAAAGCQDEASPEPPAEELAAEVEEIDPALIANLPAGVTPEIVEEGRELFVVCSVCHGLDGNGTPLGPSLRDPVWIHISGNPEEIAGIIRSGVADPAEFPAPMPPMGGGDFDETELRSLVEYVTALGRAGQ